MSKTWHMRYEDVEDRWGYTTQKEYIKEEYGDVKLKRGRWRVLLHEYDDYHDLWHQCDKDDWDMYDSEYMTNVQNDVSYTGVRKIKPNWHCVNCFAVPPPSVITVWCLLEPDYTSEHVQFALESQHELDNPVYCAYPEATGWGEWSLHEDRACNMIELLKR